MDLKRLEYMTCTESARVHLGVCRQVMTNIPNPYADHDIIRRSKVFVLRRIQAPHSSRMKNCPRVECRRVSISIGAIYKAAYGILSRRVIYLRMSRSLSSFVCSVSSTQMVQNAKSLCGCGG